MSVWVQVVILGVMLLCVLGFLAWAWEEPTGGLIAVGVGVFFFITGVRTVGVVIGIVGIVLYMHAKDSKKKGEKNRSVNYRRTTMSEILDACWNSDTYEFNWKLWFDRADEILYDDSDQGIRKAVHSEMEKLGKCQIRRLNMFLEWMKSSDALKATAISEIRAKSKMVNELRLMFTCPDGKSSNTYLLNMVEQYQHDLEDYIIYKRKTLTLSKLDNMISRGEAIQKA